jgi:hypothetical protein
VAQKKVVMRRKGLAFLNGISAANENIESVESDSDDA